MPRPNVIIIVTDTFRPDHLSANGHPTCRTPELDAFLHQSVTFTGARVSSFPTIPMRTDWFTGRFGHTRHGWRDLDPAAVTLPHVLGRAGYATQLIADTTHLLNSLFWRPFGHRHFLRGHESDEPLCRLNEPVKPVIGDRRKTRVETHLPDERPTLCDRHAHTNFRQRYEEESHIAQLTSVACRWLEDNYRAGPFLLWLDCFDVHEPWFPPQYLLDHYHPGYAGEPMAHPNYHSAEVYAPDELRNLQARYAAMCTQTSKHLGKVIRTIADSGLLANSIVVLMSDHGTYLGERGRTGKSLIAPGQNDCFPFHREIADIVWTMHLPAELGARPSGTRLSQPIQAPDLLPTVCDLCGLETPASVEGTSLAPLLRGESDAPPRPIAVTASCCGTSHATGMFPSRRPTVTDGEWTLLLAEPPAPEPPRLYHTAVDPGETTNVIDQHPDQALRLHAAMLEWLTAHDLPAPARERLSAENVGLA